MTRRFRVLATLVAAVTISTACASAEPAEVETIEIFGPYRGRSAELFSASLEDFAERQGVRIRYTGTSNFVTDLRQRIANVNAPDIAIVPQLGLVRELWANGRLTALSPAVVDAVDANYGAGAAQLGQIDGAHVGVLYRASVKSLVWYRPSVFRAGGYDVPVTLPELDQLGARMQGDGLAPWCMSIEARGATGWVATDWIEDLLVRQSGPALYDGWVRGDIPFDHPEVRSAFETFADLVLAPGRVNGGLERVLRATTTDAHDPLFADPAGCAMHRQASWVLDWVPSPFSLGDANGDLAAFVLPGSDLSLGAPLLVAGDHAVAFTDRPIVQDLMAHLATPASSAVWAASDSYFAARIGPDAEQQQGPAAQLQAALLADADTVVFDGSDQMPPDIGSDLFWGQITRWVAGDLTYDEMATVLDEARQR